MAEFFKEYKEKSNDEILEIMQKLKNEFERSKDVMIQLTYHIDDVEKKFNLLNEEIKKRKG
jgi:predicted  nucleic acid-binding Zn-ribbon protein|tara:strand:- start:137 stop:319 length:183 start_codon:yes stop_codon:yes gene_type:complete